MTASFFGPADPASLISNAYRGVAGTACPSSFVFAATSPAMYACAGKLVVSDGVKVRADAVGKTLVGCAVAYDSISEPMRETGRGHERAT